ncbi:MAG: AAA family ATPase [Bacillus sp. (in: Bacteria)]|nr:AAA family ATPase [Bacillus sp. (in: firmicutes)]MCM1427764.1 AAA family ATPase [Eubacterium sp.]
MKLEYLYLDGYKGIKELKIHFDEQSAPVAVNFFVGRNGSGKSRILEAVGLIFTRIMQEELPGFYFEIWYSMPDGVRVFIKPQAPDYHDESGRRRKLYVRVEQKGKVSKYSAVPNEYLPSRIISYCSGANNSMEAILISSPRDALASDFYDIAMQKEADRNLEAIEEMRRYYEQLIINPRMLYLDAISSKIILPVLFAVIPMDMQSDDDGQNLAKYWKLREMLVKRLHTGLLPAAFSFQVNEELMERTADIPQIDLLRRLLEESRKKDAGTDSWVIDKTSVTEEMADENQPAESVAVFLYSQYDKTDERSFYHPGLQKFFDGNALHLISVLLTAYREGIIKDVHFFYRNSEQKGLFRTKDLSDGELMWLARTGLILLAQSHCGDNMLFLYDEPDVHFNDDWNRDFIHIIYELNENTKNAFLIATHSTLLLTDAMYGQITLLDNADDGQVTVEDIDISTFAAQRDEISKHIFKTNAIGKYAADSVNEMIEEVNRMEETKEIDLEKIRENISKLGPGYQRFQMYEAYYSLADVEMR